MKRLWINADDLGLTLAVSDGICEALERGILTTTTAMVCSDDALDVLAVYCSRVEGRIGLHLQLTDGVPRSAAADVPSLIGADGRFPRYLSGLGEVKPREVELEWEAQLATLRSLGVEPTHVDSHHHVHQSAAAFEAYARLAKRHGLPARGGTPEQTFALRQRGVMTADVFSGEFFRGGLNAEHLLAVAETAARRCPEDGVIELMSHPGRVDDTLRRRSIYVEERERELATLCDSNLPAQLRARGYAPLREIDLGTVGPRLRP